MVTKIILLFLTIGQILASSYIEDGKRVELFEIMDNEVPTFRVTVPNEKFELLKAAMQTPKFNLTESFNNMDNPDAEYNGYDTVEFEKIKDATLLVEINDTKKEFSKVTFDIGGSSARTYGRQGFNLKIRDNNKDLYGRTQFRIRSDPRDATYLRSKLSCDMLNRLGVVSISANYIILYVNEEYFGFYVLMDAPKIPWIEQVYGEKDTKDLYKCKSGFSFLSKTDFSVCENENDEITDMTDWNNFLEALDNAQTVEEIDEIFDVDQFLYLSAFDYLVGAWDHFFHLGHNYSMYKNKKNGKWTMFYYDFDSDIGQDVVQIEFFNFFPRQDKDYPHYTLQDWFTSQIHLQEVLIFNNLPRFEAILAEVVDNVFNPTLLFPHIDELKDFIRPYIVHDKTPDEDGHHPGVLNLLNPCDYSIQQWEANSEFTTINDPINGSDAYGIKYWILERYRAVCTHYALECDPVYMDENYKYTIDREVEGQINTHKWDGFDWLAMMPPMEEPTEQPIEPVVEPTEQPSEEPVVEPIEQPSEEPVVEPIKQPSEEPVVEPIEQPSEEPLEEPSEESYEVSSNELYEESNEESFEESS